MTSLNTRSGGEDSTFLSNAPSSEPSPAIVCQGLNHWYGEGLYRQSALFDIHLRIRVGEIVLLMGPSGSGNTTLLNLIGGSLPVQDGSLIVLGQELAGADNRTRLRFRRRIGFIFRDYNLIPSLTVLQNVALALRYSSLSRREQHRRVSEILTELGLKAIQNYMPHQLSGGQKQCVATARALVHEPKLILSDEPTAALDEASGRDVVNLLKKLSQEKRCTTLIVTHDNCIFDVADRMVSMANGHIKSNVVVQEEIEICEFLKECDVFSQLTPSTLTTIAEEMQDERQPAGSVIIRQGDKGDKFYLIKSGTVDVIVNQGQPDEAKVATLHKGQFFGEMGLLLDAPRNATVIARQDVELYTLDKPHFLAAIAASEPFRKELEKILFQRQ